MGLVIKISFCHDWNCVYFVQDLEEREAKKKAFKHFKQTTSCYLPETLEEAEEDDNFSAEVLATVEATILF